MASLFLVTGSDGRWQPGIGDPGFLGWFTVVAYFAASYATYRAYRMSVLGAGMLRQTAPDEAANQRLLSRFWLWLTVILVLLGINKQLDLQSLFTQVLRDMAREQGWYEVRRHYQVEFIGAVAVGGAAAVGGCAYLLRRVLRRVMPALFGLGLLVSFVAIRAASFHHVDLLLGKSSKFGLNWLFELGGIAILGVAAYRTLRQASTRATSAKWSTREQRAKQKEAAERTARQPKR